MEGKVGSLMQRMQHKEMVASHDIGMFGQWWCSQVHLHILGTTRRVVPTEQATVINYCYYHCYYCY